MRNLILPVLLVAGFIGGLQSDGIKRYKDDMDKEQLALEGKAPPAITATEWVNSKALTWKALKGKVVVIDLWAYW